MTLRTSRLPGAMQLGCFGSSVKPWPRLWKTTPDLGAARPEPKLENTELMNDTAVQGAAIPHVGNAEWGVVTLSVGGQHDESDAGSPAETVVQRVRKVRPFGGGSRLCIGKEFALLEARLVLATVAQRFRLQLAPGQRVAPRFAVTLSPRYGMQMQLTARTGPAA